MASVASQLIQEVTAHAQSDSLEDAREICADGTYFPNNLRRRYTDVFSYNESMVNLDTELVITSYWYTLFNDQQVPNFHF